MPTLTLPAHPVTNGCSTNFERAMAIGTSIMATHANNDEAVEQNGAVVRTDTQAVPLASVLYSSNVFAKIWVVAVPALTMVHPPTLYPEYTKPDGTKYVYRELDFWTSGFFPGSLYLLLERERRYSIRLRHLRYVIKQDTAPSALQLAFLCHLWTVNLHQNASLSSTHDLGFMIHPWARLAWELEHDVRAYNTIIRAARTLAARFSPAIGAIRSWDTCITKRYSFQDPSEDFLVIIDNMMNLDMIFWAAAELKSDELYEIAATHARTTQRSHIREDASTTHLVVFDPKTCPIRIRSRLTNQGYNDDSTWARGQAWAVAGFAQVYHWTRDPSFLETSRRCADYFITHLPPSRIPPWDFLAPAGDALSPTQPPDTSAALIAVYGMLLLHEAHLQGGADSSSSSLSSSSSEDYLTAALDILAAVCSQHMNPATRFTTKIVELATIVEGGAAAGGSASDKTESCVQVTTTTTTTTAEGRGEDLPSVPETLINGATINNYEFAPRRWADHGLVYADYYFLLIGNKLLELGVTGAVVDIMVHQQVRTRLTI